MLPNRSARALVLAATLVGAGCRDSATSPVAPVGAAVGRDIAAAPSDSAIYDFVVTPSGGQFVLGGTTVTFPARSICDPATSGYGPALWDAPCAPLDAAIAIHAVVRNAGDSSTVQFSPALRFVPADSKAGYVSITMTLPNVAGTAPTPAVAIDWLPLPGGLRVDERPTDATLVTTPLAGGAATRRIKHFSGYIISTG